MKFAFVDYRITDEELNNLNKFSITVLKIPPCNALYPAITGHPDILINILDNNKILVHKDIQQSFINDLEKYDFQVIVSNVSLGSLYPMDISLNSVAISNLFVHNTNFTDPILLEFHKSKKIINVKQGYTKCSTIIVNDTAIITSDKSIGNKLLNEGIDVLILPPKDIILPHLDYGFIGGTCGLIEKDLLVFYGNISNYAYKEDVLSFLNKHNVKTAFLSDGNLMDRGSILFAEH